MTLPASARTPQVRASIVFGSSGAAPGTATRSILLVGSMLAAAVEAVTRTGAATSTTVTTAAGLAVPNRPTRVFSPDDAAVQAGRGVELSRAAKAVFDQYRGAEVWIAPLPPAPGAVAASATITPTVSTLAAGTVRLTVMGESVDLAVSAADTPSTIGMKLAQAINSRRDWPVTASNVWATGATTVTAKWAGPRGHGITLRLALLTGVGAVEVLDGTAQQAFGLTLTLTGGTADGGVYRLAGGATDDDSEDLLDALAPLDFDRVCLAGYRVGGALTLHAARVCDQVDRLSDERMAPTQVVFGSVESPGQSIALAQQLNRPRAQWVDAPGSDDLPLVIAAQVAAARLFGDGAVGGSIPGEASEPACNLNDVELATLRAPRDAADLYDGAELEAALAAGVTPLKPSATRPGRMALVASITTRSLAGGVADDSVYKTKDVTVSDFVRAYVVGQLRTTYRGFNLVDDDPSGSPPLRPRTVAPRQVRGRLYGLLKDLEQRGVVTEVDARDAEIAVTRNAVNPRRLDFTFPVVAPSDFDIADGTLYQRRPAS